MGTCLSGYTDSFADLLVSKGAAVVFVNSGSILRQYNLNMMEAVMTGLRDGMTVSQALSYAKAQHGETSAYTAQTEEGPVTHTAHVYYRGQEGADRLAAALPDHIAQHDDYHSFLPASFVSSTDNAAEPNSADSAAEKSAGSGARAETVCPAGPVRSILQQCSAWRAMGPQSPP